MKHLKTILLAAALVAGTSVMASAAESSTNTGPDGMKAKEGQTHATTSGAMKSGTSGSAMKAKPGTTGTETPSDPAAAGIGARDKQTGASKDKN